MPRVIAGVTAWRDGFVNDRDGSVGRLYPDVENCVGAVTSDGGSERRGPW